MPEPLRVLLVTPVAEGSGETITALHVAESLAARGDEVRFLASPFAARFLAGAFAGRIDELTADGVENHDRWRRTVAGFRPEVVVFADYPLLFFPRGSCPLGRVPGWREGLEEVDATLVTLDHFGFAQRTEGMFMGPPHFGLHYQEFAPLPERMHVLLPCPMHEPGAVEGRRGEPFRYWRLPLGVAPEERAAERRRWLGSPGGEGGIGGTGGEGLLVFHSVPTWAWRAAEELGLDLYRHLPRLLASYLADLDRPVTLVSVNNGRLLAPPADAADAAERGSPGLRLVNLGPVPKEEFERLLFSCDLMLTENKLSISMGKAICGLVPCAALRNGYRLGELVARSTGVVAEVVQALERQRLGAVYPFEVFPTVVPDDLREIGLYRGNSLTRGFAELELFGGEGTARALRALLTDRETREVLAEGQRRYAAAVARLDEAAVVLDRLVDHDGGPGRGR